MGTRISSGKATPSGSPPAASAKEKKKKKKKEESDKKRKKKDSSSSSCIALSEGEENDERITPAAADAQIEEERPPSMYYVGKFLHPSFGAKEIDISVQLNSAPDGHWSEAKGHWAIMGQVVDSTVDVSFEGKLVTFADATIRLEGRRGQDGKIEGEVVMGSARHDEAGTFVLTPSESPKGNSASGSSAGDDEEDWA